MDNGGAMSPEMQAQVMQQYFLQAQYMQQLQQQELAASQVQQMAPQGYAPAAVDAVQGAQAAQVVEQAAPVAGGVNDSMHFARLAAMQQQAQAGTQAGIVQFPEQPQPPLPQQHVPQWEQQQQQQQPQQQQQLPTQWDQQGHLEQQQQQTHWDQPMAQSQWDQPPQSQFDQPPPQNQLDQPAPQTQYDQQQTVHSQWDQSPPQTQWDQPPPQTQWDQPPQQTQWDQPPSQAQWDQPPSQTQWDQPATQSQWDQPPPQTQVDQRQTQWDQPPSQTQRDHQPPPQTQWDQHTPPTSWDKPPPHTQWDQAPSQAPSPVDQRPPSTQWDQQPRTQWDQPPQSQWDQQAPTQRDQRSPPSQWDQQHQPPSQPAPQPVPPPQPPPPPSAEKLRKLRELYEEERLMREKQRGREGHDWEADAPRGDGGLRGPPAGHGAGRRPPLRGDSDEPRYGRKASQDGDSDMELDHQPRNSDDGRRPRPSTSSSSLRPPPPLPPQRLTLLIRNLGRAATEEDLRLCLRRRDVAVGRVSVCMDVAYDCCKGYAFADLADPGSAEHAVQVMHHADVAGKLVTVELFRPRGSRRGRSRAAGDGAPRGRGEDAGDQLSKPWGWGPGKGKGPTWGWGTDSWGWGQPAGKGKDYGCAKGKDGGKDYGGKDYGGKDYGGRDQWGNGCYEYSGSGDPRPGPGGERWGGDHPRGADGPFSGDRPYGYDRSSIQDRLHGQDRAPGHDRQPGHDRPHGHERQPRAAERGAEAKGDGDGASGATSLFVGGLSFRAEEADIRGLFEKYQIAVEKINIATDRETGKSKGYAFVELKEARQAERGMRLLNGVDLCGRSLTVEIKGGDRGPRPNENKPNSTDEPGGGGGDPNNTRIFVGGVSFMATDETLKEKFSEIGHVKSARIVTDKDTGKPKGFAFVEYSTVQEAQRAMQKMQGAEICGRPVRIDLPTKSGTSAKAEAKDTDKSGTGKGGGKTAGPKFQGMSSERRKELFGSLSRSRSRSKKSPDKRAKKRKRSSSSSSSSR